MATEFITMMTGRSRHPAPEPAAPEPTPTVAVHPPTASPASDMGAQVSAAVRGVSAVSAMLKRQKQASQVYKDAWLGFEPSLEGSITQSQLRQLIASLGLDPISDTDIEDIVDSVDGEGKITCEFLKKYVLECLRRMMLMS